MAYHKITLAQLSHTQIGKLMNGHRIRVRHGHKHHIHVSEEQHKKIMKANQKGAGTTIQFDPFQIHHHQHLRGEGFMDIVKGGLKSGLKYGANKLVDVGADMVHSKINGMGGGALLPAGYGTQKRRGRKGKGVIGSIAKLVAPAVIGGVASYVKDHHMFGTGSGHSGHARGRRGHGLDGMGEGFEGMGEGIKRRGRKGHGEGLFDDISKYGQMALDYL